MIAIDYKEHGNVYELAVRGHAGYAPHGSDIVCAAVSALCQTLAASVAEEIQDCTLRQNAGEMYICARARCKSERLISLELFEHTLRGLRALAREYPKNIKISGMGVVSPCRECDVQ